jgi:hypothetical protein
MNWNLVAAIFGIVAGVLTTIAATLLFIQEQSLANGCGIAAGVLGALCGVTWTVAVMGK